MKPPIPHGTRRGAERHYEIGEKPCEPCRLDRNEYAKASYRRNHSLPNFTTRIILDHLETFGPMSIQELTWLIQRRHDIKSETIRRAVHRMVSDWRLSSWKNVEGRVIVEAPDEN